MDSLLFDDNLVTIDRTDYSYVYHQTLLDNSLPIYIIQNYNLEKLKEVLNYHNIKNKKNLLQHFQSNPIIGELKNLFEKSDYKFKSQLNYFEEYSKILEYIILNFDPKNIDYIINEIRIDNGKINWDYLEKKLTFGLEDYSRYIRIILGSIIKIISEHGDVDNVMDNCMYALEIVMKDHIFFRESILKIFLVFSFKKKSYLFFNKLKNYVKTTKLLSELDKYYFEFDLEHYFKIKFE